MDLLWWNKVTNASHFLSHIIEYIQEGQNIILQLPECVPWYMTMRDIISTEVARLNSTRAYKCVTDSGIEPGEYLFNEFCKQEKRAHYRPGIGYAEFLAGSDDIVLNDYILWVSDVAKEQVKKWYSFIGDYTKALGKKKHGCIFLIETRSKNNLQEKKGIRNISYEKEIEYYDNYLFNMLAASSLKESALFKRYLAEVVSTVLFDDVELASKCVGYGRNFLENPIETICQIVENELRSDGTEFTFKMGEKSMQEYIWEAQIKVIFPLVEKHRSSIIKKYKAEIERLLPIKAVYGEVFNEANDVELGTISYLASIGKIEMSGRDSDKVLKLKEARNTLAHLGILPQEKVDEIFDL